MSMGVHWNYEKRLRNINWEHFPYNQTYLDKQSIENDLLSAELDQLNVTTNVGKLFNF